MAGALAVSAAACAAADPRVGRLVLARGAAPLHATIAGHGRPVVVLEAGLGEDSGLWSSVIPLIARDTTVVAYDRAGLGASPDRGAPRDGMTEIGELRAMLRAARLPPPLVLVGHSYGGLLVRLYAARWPDEVAGLVLVDATHEDFPRVERALRPKAVIRRQRALIALSGPVARREFEELEQTVRDVRTAGPLPPVPMIVIASGRPGEDPRFRRAWLDLQRDLASRSPRGTLILLPATSHNVPVDAPASVAEAVRAILEQVRPAQRGARKDAR